MALNGWAAPAQVSVIAGNHQSILGRDLKGTLGLELVQRGKVMEITGKEAVRTQRVTTSSKRDSVSCTQIFFTRIGKIRNSKVRAEFFELLKPVQLKGRRVPISLEDKVDKVIQQLITEANL